MASEIGHRSERTATVAFELLGATARPTLDEVLAFCVEINPAITEALRSRGWMMRQHDIDCSTTAGLGVRG